jgi:hypothetical protein
MGGGWQRMFEAIRGASSAVPRLAQGPGIQGREMLGEAVGHLKNMAGSGRADAFRNFAQQIGDATRGAWTATEMGATNARVFLGEAGEALVFDRAGNMFRGRIGDAAAFVLQKGGEYLVNFDKLNPIR